MVTAECRGQRRGEARGPGFVRVEDGDPLRSQPGERVTDRRSGAARSQDHHMAQLRAGKPSRQAPREPRPVRVVPDSAVAGEHHGVHRPECGRLGRQIRHALDGGPLAGMGDVQAVEAEQPRGPDQIWSAGGGQADSGDVDEPVHVSQTERGGLMLVQGR